MIYRQAHQAGRRSVEYVPLGKQRLIARRQYFQQLFAHRMSESFVKLRPQLTFELGIHFGK